MPVCKMVPADYLNRTGCGRLISVHFYFKAAHNKSLARLSEASLCIVYFNGDYVSAI